MLFRSYIVKQPNNYLNLFQVQRRSLRIRAEEFVDGDIEPTEASRAGAINSRAMNCMTKLIRLNKNSQLKGFDEIFPATTRIVETAINLPLICAETKEELSTVIEHLFVTFYEGAGGMNLRFITNDLVTREEIYPIVIIKHLRNKWLQHDPQHGSKADIRKNFETLAEALESLGFERLPESKEEHSLLHLNLLVQLEAFLDLLAERLETKGQGH